jgi:cysteine desulfurase family protein
LIYLDNAATSFPKAPNVAKRVTHHIAFEGGNSGRSSHVFARNASRLVFDTRYKLASFLGVKKTQRLVFTKNATESLNMVIFGALKEGDVVGVSSLEHNSVMRPLRYLEAQGKIKIKIFSCDADGKPELEELETLIKSKPNLMVITAASNVIGALLPYEEIIEKCHEFNIPVCIDACQLVGHIPVDIDDCGADYFCFSAHKGLLAPTGVGGLYVKEGMKIKPLMFGGTGSASDSEYQPEDFPDFLEAGTQNLSAIAGLNASLDFFQKTGLEEIKNKEEMLIRQLKEGLSEFNNIKIYGDNQKLPVISFEVENQSIGDTAYEFDKRDIAIRMGLHCSPLAHKSIKSFEKGGTLRMSPSYFTKQSEIEEVLSKMREFIK